MLHESDPNRVTARETEVWALLADDYTYAEIAVRLSISEHTVDNHVSAILRKTGSKNRAEAARHYRSRPHALRLWCHGEFWDPSISDFRPVEKDWYPGTTLDCPYFVAPTTNAYGYHQIKYQGFESTTYETHAN